MNKKFEPFDDLFYRNLKTSNRNQQWNTDENNINDYTTLTNELQQLFHFIT
jgi:hypothetical protein